MFDYKYAKKLSNEKLVYYRNMLIKVFAYEYDFASSRLWNCLKEESTCLEFESARKMKISGNVLFYLERQNEVYDTTFANVCRYVDELEPWEYIDAYVFDREFKWLLAITHEDLKCLTIRIEE